MTIQKELHVAEQVYAALMEYHAGMPIRKIAALVGCDESTIRSLKRGHGVGKKAAKYLARRKSKYKPLLDDVMKCNYARKAKSDTKRSATIKAKKVEVVIEVEPHPLDRLPKHVQAFAGYIAV
jgi:uncharacterized protein YjcR